MTFGDEFILSSVFRFNFGASLDTGCVPYHIFREDNVSAIEVDEIFADLFETCSILGRHEMTSVELLDKKNPSKGV